VNLAWIVLGLGIIGSLVRLTVRPRESVADLGSVSRQWLVEHRLDDGFDQQR
jgi:hypothetical protein